MYCIGGVVRNPSLAASAADLRSLGRERQSSGCVSRVTAWRQGLLMGYHSVLLLFSSRGVGGRGGGGRRYRVEC